MEIQMSRDERRRLKEYAEALGLPEHEALIHAARVELDRRYRLKSQQGSVVNFEGLKRDRTDP